MSRRKAAPKREILPDPVYQSKVVAKFVNHVMENGKKSVAERIVYGAFDHLFGRIKNAPQDKKSDDEGGSGAGSADHARVLAIFDKALSNVRPNVEVKSRRVGGSTYQVPIEVRQDRGTALAMRWITDSARGRNEKGMMLRLAGELFEAYEGRGGAAKKREDVHRMAKANQAFAHYRW